MNTTTSALLGTTLAAVFCALSVPSARADAFGIGPNAFTIDFVPIGNPGNADDGAFDNTFPGYSSPNGGVSYSYRMGKYEISQDQITKATLNGLLNVTAGAHAGNKPAANTTWYEAAAFVNWLNIDKGHQPAYNLTFSGSWSMALWGPTAAWSAGGQNLYRHKDAYYFLPSDDEWYKAAFHKNDGVTANYWDYATGSDSIPTAVASGTGAFTAVYGQSGPAEVHLAGGLSPYGTMGQNGNIYEVLESAVDGVNDSPTEGREIHGGRWSDSEGLLRSSAFGIDPPSNSWSYLGFRVASVPEPSSAVLMLSAGLLALARRRRRAAH